MNLSGRGALDLPSGLHVRIPPIHEPVPHKVSPLIADMGIVREVTDWCVTNLPARHLREHLEIAILGIFACCPDAVNRAACVLEIKCQVFAFVFDDHLLLGDESVDLAADLRSKTEQATAIIEICQGRRSDKNRFESAFQKIINASREIYTPWLADRLEHGFIEWMDVFCEREKRGNINDLGFTEYVKFRVRDAAPKFVSVALLGPQDFHVENIWQDIEDLWIIAFESMALTNDIYSYNKEQLHGEQVNALYSLHVNEGYGFQEGMDFLVQHINNTIHEFQRAWPMRVARLPAAIRAEATRWFRSIEQAISGHLYAVRVSQRYRGGGFGGALLDGGPSYLQHWRTRT